MEVGDSIPTEVLQLPYDFRHRPQLVPGALAARRRVPLLLLLVAKSYGAGVSWRTLQVLSWAIHTDSRTELLSALRTGRDLPDRPIVRFDPTLDRVIDLAVGLDYLAKKSSRVFRLTDRGRLLVDRLGSSEAFIDERRRLSSLVGKLSKAEIDRFIEWRTE
jgi:hypothetical protein